MQTDVGLRHQRPTVGRKGSPNGYRRKFLGMNSSVSHEVFSISHGVLSGRKGLGECRSSSADGVSTKALETSEPLAYPYNDADGKRQKATIEHIFPALDSSSSRQPAPSSSGRPAAPWQVGWQMNERNVYWNDELKTRLIKRIASDELGISDEEMDERLQQLGALLPGLQDRLMKAPPKLVARLAANTSLIASRLLALKLTFPQANLSTMTSNRLSLLLDDELGEVEVAARRLRELLPEINLDRFVETFPLVLDVECFEMALDDARRIMPGIDVTAMLRSNPNMILSLVKGKNMIPYDQISNPWA